MMVALPSTDADDPERRAGGQLWRDISAALYTRLRGQLTDTWQELSRVYPTTWSNYSPRPVAWIPWISRQIASTLTEEPSIVLVDPVSGKPLPEAVQQEAIRYMHEARATEALLAAHEEACAPGNGVVWVEPVIRTGADGAPLMGVECNVVPAHAQAVELKERPRSKDERDVTAWRVSMTLPGGTDATGVYDGVALVTPTEAVWEVAGGDLRGEPIWPRTQADVANNAPTNPLGEVPAVVVRWNEPQSGCFWGNAREDLLWQARALDAGGTDLGEGVRHGMFGQWISRKLPGAGKIKMGFGTIVDLGDEKDADLKCEGAKSDFAGGRDTLEQYTRMATASQDGNPAVLMRSTAITAEGKKIEIADREGLRKRHLTQLRRAYQRIYDLIRKWLNHLRGAEVLPPARLIVTFAPPELPENELQSEQAMELRLKWGQSSEIRERMRRDRCSYEEAKKRCIQDIKDQGELKRLRVAEGLVDVPFKADPARPQTPLAPPPGQEPPS